MRRQRKNAKYVRRELAVIVGDRLKFSREKNGISQEKAAATLGYRNSSQLSKIEKAVDSRLPPIEKLIEMATLYEVSIDFVLGQTDDWDIDEKEVNRRGVTVACKDELRDIIEQYAGHTSNVETMLEGFGEHLRESVEINNEAVVALERFIELNTKFQDMKGGAKLVRCITDARQVMTDLSNRLDRLKIKKAKPKNINQVTIFQVLDG
ncbi:helix-turn-helix domain-containing protein [Methylocucumis oryzae]|uniref:HTH cro/C1-type domain-containing protein n=1 Tax=Methylocucumis oryzae TaxID=1632867 RepID=A0A0F3IN87_9GAMM|nr:helix-turn-helix transcriptional regulator [Methylocucumis oryzae]KJV08023.1 hypothetical protein VZ94_01020 [Methylocucumis oryzae]